VSKFLPDTNILQAKNEQLPKPLYISSVVFCELITACNDTKELRAFQAAWKAASNGR
jgi:predicted nucleic acid-binding protein